MLVLIGHTRLGAQVNVTYNGTSFGACEIVKAGIGNTGESLSLIVSEINMDQPELQSDNVEAPENYQLLLEVSLPEGVPFPITAERKNQLTIGKSSIQHGIDDNQYFNDQMAANADQFEARAAAGRAAQDDKQSIEERTKAIVAKMQSGELSVEEATKQLEVIMQEADALIEAIPDQPDIEDLEEPALYSILFSDTRENVESQAVVGQLHISRFTETEFVATFTGQHVVECYNKRAVAATGSECSQVESSLMPGSDVLREEDVRISINVKLKEFNDFR
ncbi:MAG: hypothetical protein AAF741_18505 [Bacteroidota bacterium]